MFLSQHVAALLKHADIKIQEHTLCIMFIQNVFPFSGLLVYTYIDIKYEYMVNLLHVSVFFGRRQGSIRQKYIYIYING